jgi:hypothetical protein
MAIKQFRSHKEALAYATEIYGAVYFDSRSSSLEPGVYLVPETQEEKNVLEDEQGLQLATGNERPESDPAFEDAE